MPCFAQHIDLSALPLRFLTMAYRMLGRRAPGLPDLVVLVFDHLPAYPPDVQAQTLMSLLSLLLDQEGTDIVLTAHG